MAMAIRSAFGGKNSRGQPSVTSRAAHLCDAQQAQSPGGIPPSREPWRWSTPVTTPYEPKKLSPEEMAELHALPDDALATAQEAAAFLRLKYNTLSWYRCNGGGPKYVRVGPKLIRYRMGDLREYAKGQPMGEGMRKVGAAMLAARTAKAEG